MKGMYDPQVVLEQWVGWHESEAGEDKKTCPGNTLDDDDILHASDLKDNDQDLIQPEVPKSEALLPNKTGYDLSICLLLDGDEESIEVTLASLVAQGLEKSLDILLWDARGSGEAILRQEGFTRIQKIHFGMKPGENYAAGVQNTCVQQASGSHLLFIQSGQILMEGAISQLWSASLGRQLDITTSFMSMYTRPAKGILKKIIFVGDSFSLRLPPGMKTYPFVFLGKAVLPGLYQNVFGGPLMIVKREALRQVGDFSTVLGGGYSVWEFYSKAAYAHLSMEVVPGGLYLTPMKQGYTRNRNDGTLVQRVIGHYLESLSEGTQRDVLNMRPESIPFIVDL